MQYLTFFFEMKKQSPEAQRWLEDRQYGQANDGFSMELSYNQDNIPICLLEVDTEKVEIIHHPFPEAFHLLEERFRWTQVMWFQYAYGQLFQLKPKRGKQIWIATSLVLESNRLEIGAK